jgi:hypothetical protein
MKTIERTKLRCDLRPDERRAVLTLKKKGLKVDPSDKKKREINV